MSYLKYNSYTLVVSNSSFSKKYEKLGKISRKEDLYLQVFLAELNYLNRYFTVDKSNILLYIGTTLDDHIVKLAIFYPEIDFRCYGKNKTTQIAENVTIYNREFTDDDVLEYQDMTNLYVISNFSNVPESLTGQEKEKLLSEEMMLQMKWIQGIKPKSALLKFRPPHYYEGISVTNKFEYFIGTIWRTVFSKPKTVECRLVVDNYDTTILYDFQKFEEIMHYYNDVTRETNMEHPISQKKIPFGRYENNFDYMVMFNILKEYLETRGHVTSNEEELINLYKFIFN